jgi:copper transport protein
VLRLTIGAWGGLAAATLAAILLQGVYGAGQGIGHVFWPDVLHATLDSGYGRALGARLVLVVVALIAFSVMLGSLPTANRRGRLVIAVTWAAVTIGLASTWALSDHAGTGIQVPLAVPSDIIHLTAIAVWLGGLVTLVTIVLRRPDSPADAGKSGRRYQAATAEAARAVSRFSPIALGCVSAIVATGTYQAWRGVGSWGALFETTYGRLLLVKIVAVCALVALGNLARQQVQRLRAPAAAMVAAQASPVREAAPANVVTLKAAARARADHSPRPRRIDTHTGVGGADESAQLNADQAAVTLTRLRWSVSIEVAIVAAVLAVTAVLVNTPTARETYRPPTTATAAFDTGGPQGTGKVSVLVTPARLGPNVFRVSVTNGQGQPYRPQQVQAALALPERNLGPLPVTLTTNGPGTYLSAPAIVTITGQWQLRITIRSDAFDETTVMIPVTVH